MVAPKITEQQLKDELAEGLTPTQIATKYGMSVRGVQQRVYELRARGFDPENYRQYSNPPEQPVSGYSTLYKFPEDDPLGRVLEWVKTNVKVSDQLKAVERIIEGLAQEIPPIEQVKYLGNKRPNKKHITVIPIGDPHVGLLVWKKETGESWDCEIALRVYHAVFSRLLSSCPDTEECILINTGDFFHADNIDGVTARGKNKLDLDGRHGKWLDVGGALLVMFIDTCLKKYKKVTFVNIPGNHDDILGRFLGTTAELVYRNEPRLSVMKGDSPRQYIQRDVVGMGFAHSHLCKMKQLPQAMAMDVPQMWGATKLRMYFTGHVHHDQETIYKDNNGCIVLSAGIIPPPDAYAYGVGYRAFRTIQAAILDIEHGEIVSRPCATVRASD